MSESGYRADDGEVAEPDGSVNRNRVYLIASLLLFVFSFLLNALSWFTERGGVFSIASALGTVSSKPPVIDIDKSGLWLPFLIVTWLISVGFCRLFDIQLDMSARGKAFLPALILIGGSFALDEAFGESLITRFMVGHGYHRCVAGDWAQGNGRSRVWFADYVLTNAHCRAHL